MRFISGIIRSIRAFISLSILFMRFLVREMRIEEGSMDDLSILFMRFVRREKHSARAHNTLAFNSLYEIPSRFTRRFTVTLKAFNSLYEIPTVAL